MMGNGRPAKREVARDVIDADFLFGKEQLDYVLPVLVGESPQQFQEVFNGIFRWSGPRCINMIKHINILSGD